MLSLRQIIENNKPSIFLVSDNQIVEDVIVRGGDKNFCSITTKHKGASDDLSLYKFKDFYFATYLTLTEYFEIDEFYFDVLIFFPRSRDKKLVDLDLRFTPDLRNWKFPFTVSEYFALFSDIWNEKYKSEGNINEESFENEVEIIIEFVSINLEQTIVSELSKYGKFLLEVHEKTIEKLKSSVDRHSVSALFNFPEEIRVPCEQYLLYFVQFLRDLGINATRNLKEEAGKILFTVTPTDDVEALDKIREALAIYLKLPESPILYNESFAAMKLQQQIENLQHSQRMAARELQFTEKLLIAQSETIQEKNLTISQQQSVIEQQNKIIEKITSKSIMVDSLENKDELEKFCEGFEVGKSEFLIKYFGLHLNPATVLKNAGRKILGKEENESTFLKLDEESNKKDN